MQPQATLKRDDSLIGYLRRLTVAERLALNDAAANAANELRAAVKKSDKLSQTRQ